VNVDVCYMMWYEVLQCRDFSPLCVYIHREVRVDDSSFCHPLIVTFTPWDVRDRAFTKHRPKSCAVMTDMVQYGKGIHEEKATPNCDDDPDLKICGSGTRLLSSATSTVV
jgi:hypothetical protein